jgi:hypothetical protein
VVSDQWPVRAASPWERIIAELRERGIEFEEGLTDGEIRRAQSRYKLKFPPDLREFLQTAFPVSDGFAAWRADDDTKLRASLAWPADGMAFDAQRNQHWRKYWSERAGVGEVPEGTARRQVALAPRLVPIYAHRFIPSEPLLPGNPVFSVYQTDIIYYGYDLADYLRQEFHLEGRDERPEEVRPIRFWDDFVRS